MGYYRCERAPNEARGLVRSLMQPISAFCSSCGRGLSFSHLRAGAVIGNNEIREVRAHLSVNRFESEALAFPFPRISLLLFLILTDLPFCLFFMVSRGTAQRTRRTNVYEDICIKKERLNSTLRVRFHARLLSRDSVDVSSLNRCSDRLDNAEKPR